MSRVDEPCLRAPTRVHSWLSITLLLAVCCCSNETDDETSAQEPEEVPEANLADDEQPRAQDPETTDVDPQEGQEKENKDDTENSRGMCKRGVAYGYHSKLDLQVLSPAVSWWYNWDFRPDEALRAGEYRDEQVEYVPMIWGEKSNLSNARNETPPDSKTLLGFNEPNFGQQANLSAQQAATLWPELEAIADPHKLRLVSPAVNFCGGDCQDTDPFNYLHEFFDACDGCRVDAIAIHIYVGCSPSGNNKAEWLIGHIERYKREFDLPLWLTEFACDNASDQNEQRAFMEDALEYLEAEPRVERYAWFAGRADNVPHVDLLGADGQLTALGEAYVDAPQPPECQK